MEIDNLIIELTRRCNLKCLHCLRGNQQKVDIDPNVVCKFLKKNNITQISTLTFTGGEPCLNIPAMKVITDCLVKNKITILCFYMATNGTIFNPDMIAVLSKLYMITEDKDNFLIQISNDRYHTKKIDPRWNIMNFEFKYKDKKDIQNVICEGRGSLLNNNGRLIEDDEWVLNEEKTYIEGTIYINAKGHLLKNCDYSYKTQKTRQIGHCLSKPLLDFIGD